MNRAKAIISSFLATSIVLACGQASGEQYETPEQLMPQALWTTLNNAAIQGELWIDRDSQAAQDAQRVSQPDDARRIRYIADQPMAHWLGEWSGDVESQVRKIQIQAGAAGKISTLVLYNIPYRDCGSYSAGGSKPSEYRSWVEAAARGLGSQQALIILEPDALAQIDCLPPSAHSERFALLRDAVAILKRAPGAHIYLDAGHPAWHPTDVMAERLLQSGIMAADGFSLNVSNFQTLAANIGYGQTLRTRLGGKNFIIDTSRNGVGPDPMGQWCNPRARALGPSPTLQPGIEGVDALLWIKRPGESDGTCNGGPAAGQWWRDIALDLAKGAGL